MKCWISLTHPIRISSKPTAFESKHILAKLDRSFEGKTRVYVSRARVKGKDRKVDPPVMVDISEKLVVSREYVPDEVTIKLSFVPQANG